MNVNINFLRDHYWTYDKPYPYNDNITVYPVFMQDYHELMWALECLQIDKMEFANSMDVMRNVAIIQMTNLNYLFDIISETDSDGNRTELADVRLSQFVTFLKICLHIDPIDIQQINDDTGKISIVIVVEDINKKLKIIPFTYADFDNLRKICVHQHIPDYDDTQLSPEIKQEIARTRALQQKNYEIATLEMRLSAYSSHYKCNKKDIFNLSVREFLINEDMYDRMLNYQIYRTAESSGMVEFKEPIEHYLYRFKKKHILDMFMSLDEMEDKVKT